MAQQGIKGLEAYRLGQGDWDAVGLAAGEDNSILLEYDEPKTLADILGYFSSRSLSPVCRELLDKVGEANYGTSPQTVASSGFAYLDEFVPNTKIVLKKNPNCPDASFYRVSGWQFVRYDEAESLLAAFAAGDLDVAAVPNSEKADYVADPRSSVIPSSSILRLLINGFGTEADRDAYLLEYMDSGISATYEPEPILKYPDMRWAIYLAIDRNQMISDLGILASARYTQFSGFALSDGRTFTQFGGTDPALSLWERYSPDFSVGATETISRSIFHQTVLYAIGDGYYVPGTADQYTVIHLSLAYADIPGSVWENSAQWIKTRLESVLVNDEGFVKVQIDLQPVSYPEIYDDCLRKAGYDLGLGSVAVCLCEHNYFLDYSEDVSQGYQMNFGIDTTSPLIPVCYRNAAGNGSMGSGVTMPWRRPCISP